MKTHKDLEEQKAFEREEFSFEDEKMYTLLFNELAKEDELTINPEFAPNIAAKLAKKKRRDYIRESILFGGAIVMVLVITVGGLQMAQSLLDTEKTFLDNRFLLPLVSLVGLITIFQVVDKMYIKNRKFRRYKLK